MPIDPSKCDWMNGLFDEELWGPPLDDEDLLAAAYAPLDAGCEAGVR